MNLEPIGTFHCAAQHAYDAARQPAVAQDDGGTVQLEPGKNYEQAVQDLAGFSHAWLIYLFDRNTGWKPMVQPPRADRKVGVFASRAPYRPNPIGLSCVEIRKVTGLRIEVGAHDLLDGTPILDIKPYLPYADSIPDATTGWIAEATGPIWDVTFAPAASDALDWLEAHGAGCPRAFLLQQLRERPTDTKRKRVRVLGEGRWEIAYRTWRATFRMAVEGQQLVIESIASGYAADDLESAEDPHEDKAIHRAYLDRDTR